MSNPFDDLKADGDTDDEVTDDEDAAEGTDTDSRDSPTAEATTSDVSESADSEPSTAATQSSSSVSNTDSTASTTSTSESAQDREMETTTTTADDHADSEPAETGPAFEYSEVRQKPLYARDETWNDLEDELGITVTPELRRMGIRDDETREIHDAILKVAIEHIDEIPEIIAEERRKSA